MKRKKIIFWITTSIIFIVQGVITALFSQTELAKEGIKHLGYPQYFWDTLVIFKVFGALCLIIPKVPNRIKELAYAGFLFDFLFAGISQFIVDGLDFQLLFPLVFIGILALSYLSYHKFQ